MYVQHNTHQTNPRPTLAGATTTVTLWSGMPSIDVTVDKTCHSPREATFL